MVEYFKIFFIEKFDLKIPAHLRRPAGKNRYATSLG